MSYTETININGTITATWINQTKIRSYTKVDGGNILMITYGNKNLDAVRFPVSGKGDLFFKVMRHEYYNSRHFSTKSAVLNWMNDLFNALGNN